MNDEIYTLGAWREYIDERWPWAPRPDFALKPDRVALLVIDMTRWQCDPKTTWGLAKSMQDKSPRQAGYYFERLNSVVIPAIRRLVDYFHASQLQVFFFTTGPYRPDRSKEAPYRRTGGTKDYVLAKQRGEKDLRPQFEIIGSLPVFPDDIVMHKFTNSAFTTTPIDVTLRDMQIDTLLCVGAATNGCVEATGRSALDLGYKVALVEDACITQLPLLHEVTMMHFFVRGRVLKADDAIRELTKAQSQGDGQRPS